MTDEYAFGPRPFPFCCTPRLFAVAEGKLGKLGIVRAFANANEVNDMPEMFGIWNTVPELWGRWRRCSDGCSSPKPWFLVLEK